MKFSDCPRLIRAVGDALAADPDVMACSIAFDPAGRLSVAVEFGAGRNAGAGLPITLGQEDDGIISDAVAAMMASVRRKAGLGQLATASA